MSGKDNIGKDAERIRQILRQLADSYKQFLDALNGALPPPPKKSDEQGEKSDEQGEKSEEQGEKSEE
mgnify:FL=1|jgi:hypothetical protein